MERECVFATRMREWVVVRWLRRLIEEIDHDLVVELAGLGLIEDLTALAEMIADTLTEVRVHEFVDLE